jgi:hypothetical protein
MKEMTVYSFLVDNVLEMPQHDKKTSHENNYHQKTLRQKKGTQKIKQQTAHGKSRNTALNYP